MPYYREENVYVILSEYGIGVLKDLNLTERIPPDMRASRSLFHSPIYAYISAHTAQALEAELEQQNNCLKIREMYKTKEYTHGFKIECTKVQIAERALQQEFLCFCSKAASQIEKCTFHCSFASNAISRRNTLLRSALKLLFTFKI